MALPGTSRARTIALVVCGVAVVLALRGMLGRAVPPPVANENPDAARGGAGPDLESATEGTQQAAIDEIDADASSDAENARRWSLEGRLVPWDGEDSRAAVAPDMGSESHLVGVRVAALLRIGNSVRTVASGETDPRGRVSLDLSALRQLPRHTLAGSILRLALHPGERDDLVSMPGDPDPMYWDPGDDDSVSVRLRYASQLDVGPVKIDLPVHAGGCVHGRVVRPAGVLPSEQALVWGESSDDGEMAEVATAADGTFRMPVWTAGTFQVVAMFANGDRATAGPIRLAPGVEESLGTLTPVRAEYLGGIVRYADGEPVAGVSVFLWGAEWRAPAVASGRRSLEPPGRNWSLVRLRRARSLPNDDDLEGVQRWLGSGPGSALSCVGQHQPHARFRRAASLSPGESRRRDRRASSDPRGAVRDGHSPFGCGRTGSSVRYGRT